jgi:hypothetical protein
MTARACKVYAYSEPGGNDASGRSSADIYRNKERKTGRMNELMNV